MYGRPGAHDDSPEKAPKWCLSAHVTRSPRTHAKWHPIPNTVHYFDQSPVGYLVGYPLVKRVHCIGNRIPFGKLSPFPQILYVLVSL